MQTTTPQLLRATGRLTALVLALASARLLAKPEADAFPDFDSYIKISGQAASISGDGAAFASRTHQSDNGGAGIEDLHYTKDISKDVTMTLDGRALAGTEDYLLHLNFDKADVGSLDAGYKRFRTFYDGVGGFFPKNNAWFPMNQQDLHVDRGQFWAEAKLAFKDRPEFSLRYVNETRDGQKDSLIWGDTDFTGLASNNSPISTTRKLIPSYIELGERHQNLAASLKQTVGDTTVQLTVFGDWVNNLDSRYVTRYPGETKLLVSPPSSVALPAANINNQVIQTQTDGTDATIYGLTASTVTEFNPKLTVRTGLSYQDVVNNFSGSRPSYTNAPTADGTVVVYNDNNLDLAGATKARVYVGTAAVEFKPLPTFVLDAGVRGEDRVTSAHGTFTSIASSRTNPLQVTTAPQYEFSKVKDHSLTPEIGVRYTGIPDLALYASGSERFDKGDEVYVDPYNPATAPNTTPSYATPSEDHSDCKLGASWRQSAFLTLRGELFYKDHQNEYNGYSASVGDYYLLGSRFAGTKITAIAKPFATVTLTTRYVYQQGRMHVTGSMPGTGAYDSMDATSHNIGETIDWTPINQFYLQAGANVVFDVISTIYPRAGIVPAAPGKVSFDAGGVLQNSNNNYVTGTLLAGAVLTKQDDLQVQFNYYRAANGNAQLASLTMPYGVDVREESVTVGIKHKLSERLIASAKVGYFDNDNRTTGGYTNYHGPLAYISVEYGL